MQDRGKTTEQLQEDYDLLKMRLEEAEAALDAIRSGEVDALVVASSDGEQIFTLQGADQPYRVMVETMNEGAATLLEDGVILYANQRLADILHEPLETLVGSSILEYILPEDSKILDGLVEQGFRGSSRGEVNFRCKDKSSTPVLLSFSPARAEGARALSMVAADLTEQKRSEEIIAAEKLARSILDQASEAILVCDSQGVVIRANQKALDTFPVNPIYKRFDEALPLTYKLPEGEDQHELLARALDGESLQGIEAEYAPAPGKTQYFLLSAAPLLRALGQITGFTVTLTEMTERKRMEERLAFQAGILSRVHDAVIAVDEELHIIYWNKVAEQVFGWTEEEALGKVARDLFQSVTLNASREEVTGILYDTGFYEGEVLYRRKDGGYITGLISSAIMRGPEGEARGIVTSVRDITDRKRAEDLIRSYSARLEQSNKDLLEFAFIASHDLQEPLRKIESFGSQIESHAYLDPTDQDYLRRMQDAAGRMRKMIDDLLELSRITTRARPRETVDLNRVAKTVLDDLEPRIRRVQARVQIQSLPMVEADPVQMHQLLQNLVGNAVKFHRPGIPPQVEMGFHSPSPGWVEIYVKDNGIGFDPNHLEQIFQPFKRLVGRSEFDGSGIGLAVCRKIVERHGGQITARSQPGQGSTFLVTLPEGRDDAG